MRPPHSARPARRGLMPTRNNKAARRMERLARKFEVGALLNFGLLRLTPNGARRHARAGRKG